MSSAVSQKNYRQACLHLEQLESPRLLSGMQSTAVEQVFLEQLNEVDSWAESSLDLQGIRCKWKAVRFLAPSG